MLLWILPQFTHAGLGGLLRPELQSHQFTRVVINEYGQPTRSANTISQHDQPILGLATGILMGRRPVRISGP